MSEQYAEFKPYITDSKGRVFGYISVITEKDGRYYGAVQKGIKTIDGFKKWGATQPSREFKSWSDAQKWAFSTAKERGAALMA